MSRHSVGEEPHPEAAVDGATLFARYAYPPNALGYCGPDDHQSLLEAAASETQAELSHLARGFDGAWPYLEIIAGSAGVSDALDRRVVEAYWLGNSLLGTVDMATLGASLETRFRSRAGLTWAKMAASVPAGGVPHHSFHVLCVYPWVGLLRAGHTEEALEVIDRCRIRWGTVEAVVGSTALVRASRLVWDGQFLTIGGEQTEEVSLAANGYGLTTNVAPGSLVSLHWHWICDRITNLQRDRLSRLTRHHLRLVNEGATATHLAAVLG